MPQNNLLELYECQQQYNLFSSSHPALQDHQKIIEHTIQQRAEFRFQDFDYKLFLKKIIYNQNPGSGTPPFAGWYARLFFDDPEGQDGLMKKDYIVADIHTIPTDCFGAFVRWVKH